MINIKTKVYATVFLSAFGLTILLSTVGSILEGMGVLPSNNIRTAIVVFAFVLVLLMSFSMIPLAIRSFLYLLGKICPMPWVDFLKAKHMIFVYIVWIIYLIGLALALPFMIKDGFFNPGTNF